MFLMRTEHSFQFCCFTTLSSWPLDLSMIIVWITALKHNIHLANINEGQTVNVESKCPHFFFRLERRRFSIWLRFLWRSEFSWLQRVLCSLLRAHTWNTKTHSLSYRRKVTCKVAAFVRALWLWYKFAILMPQHCWLLDTYWLMMFQRVDSFSKTAWL